MILVKYHTLFFRKLGNMSQNMLSAADVIGALRVKNLTKPLIKLGLSLTIRVVWLFLPVPWVCLRFVIVVFPDHTQLLF